MAYQNQSRGQQFQARRQPQAPQARGQYQPRHQPQAPQAPRGGQQGQADEGYWDLHTNGVGYLNDVRWVTPKGNGRKAEPFLCCRISALRGPRGSADYTLFDLRVSGAEAIDLIANLRDLVMVETGHKVVVSFRVGDIYAHPYERNVRDQNGRQTNQMELAALIKGRLILIYSISVDGEDIYRRPRGDDDQGQVQAGTDNPPVAPAAAVNPRQPAFRPQSQPAQRPQPRMPQAPVGNQQQENGIADDGADGQWGQDPEPAYDADGYNADIPF